MKRTSLLLQKWMNFRTLALLSAVTMLALIAFPAPSSAETKDAVTAAITIPDGQPTPIIIKENGNALAQGTFALGTIQLFYVVKYTTAPPTTVGTFNLNMAIKTGPETNRPTAYPVNFLTLEQTGSSNLILTPAPDSFSVGDDTWTDTSAVTITLPDSVVNNPCDGCMLIGNLQLKSPSQSHLDTPTTIQVRVLLIDPPLCLSVYDLITDQAFTTIYSSSSGSPAATPIDVNVPSNGRFAGKINGTQPGQLSDNILVVNTCSESKSFDLKIALDPLFQTNPSGNPGQAVFTDSTSGSVTEGNFLLSFNFGTGTAQGQSLCLTPLTVAGNSSFLATVHTAIIKNNSASLLPGDKTFDFSATLFNSGTTLGCTVDGTPHSDVDLTSNPVSVHQPFTVNGL
jgi:hypothetical protein